MDTINQTFITNQNAVQEAEKTKLEILEEFKHPMEVNAQLLFKILADNKDTEYGKKYHFADIHSVEDYQRMVPVITYDDIGAYQSKKSPYYKWYSFEKYPDKIGLKLLWFRTLRNGRVVVVNGISAIYKYRVLLCLGVETNKE